MARKKRAKNQQKTIAIGIIAAGAVLLIAAILLLVSQGNPTTTAPQNEVSDIPYPSISRVSIDDAKTAYDQGKAIFVDVRSSGSYEAVHISGALSIPLSELEGRLNELRREAWIITYCT